MSFFYRLCCGLWTVDTIHSHSSGSEFVTEVTFSLLLIESFEYIGQWLTVTHSPLHRMHLCLLSKTLSSEFVFIISDEALELPSLGKRQIYYM